MSVYTNREDELCCPLCGETNTHVDRVSVATRPGGEDGVVIPVGLTAHGAITTNDVPLSRHVGEGRRHRIALYGWCETCGGRFALLFTQHKGVTLTESVDLTEQGKSGGAAA